MAEQLNDPSLLTKTERGWGVQILLRFRNASQTAFHEW